MEWNNVRQKLPTIGERVLVSDGKTVFEMWLVEGKGWMRPGNYQIPGFRVLWWCAMPRFSQDDVIQPSAKEP